METASGVVLLVIGMVAFANYRNGTLPDWLKAKFLNAAKPDPADQTGGGGTLLNPPHGPDPAGPNPTFASTGLGGALGRLTRPVIGPITGTFGEQRPGHLHQGVDIAAPTGTPIAAARAGRVIYSGPSSGYGLRVDIDHGGGIVTRYAHLSRLGVGVGQTVDAGSTIGLVGSTGDATGPHLHFELRQNGVAVDPYPYLTPSTVSA